MEEVKGYHIQTSACLPTSELYTSAPECEHHLQKSEEENKNVIIFNVTIA